MALYGTLVSPRSGSYLWTVSYGRKCAFNSNISRGMEPFPGGAKGAQLPYFMVEIFDPTTETTTQPPEMTVDDMFGCTGGPLQRIHAYIHT